MALTKAHPRMIEDAPISVKDFGAVGNGTADDTAAIQAAFDASNNVHFPSGTYLVTQGIYKDSETNIVISGRNATILTDGDTFSFTAESKSYSMYISDCENVEIYGITFKSSLNNGNTGWLDSSGVITNADPVSGTKDASYGLGIINSSNVFVHNNRFDSLEVGLACAMFGVSVTWTVGNAVQNNSNIVVSDNTFYNNRQHLSRTYGGCKGLRVVNNYFEYGLVKFSDSGGLGSDGLVVSNNTFKDLMTMFVAGDGIKITQNEFDNFGVCHFFTVGSASPNDTGNASYDISNVTISENTYKTSGGIDADGGTSSVDARRIIEFNCNNSLLPAATTPQYRQLKFTNNHVDITTDETNVTLGLITDNSGSNDTFLLANLNIDNNLFRYTDSASTYAIVYIAQATADGEITFEQNRIIRNQSSATSLARFLAASYSATSVLKFSGNTGTFNSTVDVVQVKNFGEFIAKDNKLTVDVNAASGTGVFAFLDGNRFDIQGNNIDRGDTSNSGRFFVYGEGSYNATTMDDFYGVLKDNVISDADGMFKFDCSSVPNSCKGFIDNDQGHIQLNTGVRWYVFTSGMTARVVFTHTDQTTPPSVALTSPVHLQQGTIVMSTPGTYGSGNPIGWHYDSTGNTWRELGQYA